MGKQGRLREKQRRQGQKRLDASREGRKPILTWDPPPAWLSDAEDAEGAETPEGACDD